jgi:hypothetical protein
LDRITNVFEDWSHVEDVVDGRVGLETFRVP